MPTSRSRTHFIFRQFTHNEIYNWHMLPPFDGFYQNLQFDIATQIAEIAAMVARGKKYFRYFSVIDFPYCADNFGGIGGAAPTTWFNWLRDNVQFNGTASFKRLRVAGAVGLFGFYNFGGVERRELIPWKDVTGSLMQSMAQKIVDLSCAPGGVPIKCSGAFFDQCWFDHRSWMYGTNMASGHGDTKESGTAGLGDTLTPLSHASATTNFGNAGSWADHTTGFQAFLGEVRARFEAASPGAYILPNGQHNYQLINGQIIADPTYYEQAWHNPSDPGGLGDQPANWAYASNAWLSDKRNVLSMQCFGNSLGQARPSECGIYQALDTWKQNGGWIAFTDDGSINGVKIREQAYLDAAMIQGGF